jgi:uncharacterized Fe-S radical SAM superfamily protein PflX
MDQYRPCGQAVDHPVLGRAITDSEFARAVEGAREEGISRFDGHTPFRIKFFAF